MWKMKKLMLVVGIFILLTSSMQTITVIAAEPTVRLPTDYVKLFIGYGTTSYFDMKLSNVAPGYHVTNKTYPGWCIQSRVNMTQNVNHTVRLYSCYDPALPTKYKNNNWNEVNYILNHKGSANRTSIQDAIWYFVSNVTFNDTEIGARTLINDTIENGGTFVPTNGQQMAICVEVYSNEIIQIQRCFLELTLPINVSLGDLVWRDDNRNGIQDMNEPGLQGITVGLYTSTGTEVDSVTTDIHGFYSFIFTAGEYYIQFTLPSNYRFSPMNQGTDHTKDSDANRTTGRTIITLFNPEQNDTSWDAGMYLVNTQGDPVEPPTHGNHAPSADGTAGEPYTVTIGGELRFNGSRSYDRDGTIVTWRWSFGDGTTGNGVTVTHLYTSTGTYPVSLTVTDNDGATDIYQTVANIKVPNRPPNKPTITGPKEGKRNIAYTFTVVTTDPDGDDIRYIITWGDDTQDNSSFFKSGNSIQLTHQWTTWGIYKIQVYAQDPSNVTSEMYETVIAIDVRYVGNLGYLINTDGKDPYDSFYSNTTKKQTTIRQQDNGQYLIDTNGDGSFDYQYNPSTNKFTTDAEAMNPLYTILIVGVIVAILLLLLVWFLARRKKNKT